MSTSGNFDNRVKTLRQARGWTQDQLATAAGLSRTGVGAIEAARLVPSVASAIALARALGCSVESLFGAPASHGRPEFAWQPGSFPCRYWMAEVLGRMLLFPVESGARGGLMHDGVARHAGDVPAGSPSAEPTLVIATCDPAAGFLADIYQRQSGFRMLPFTRSSGEAMSLVEQGLIHVAGVHFAAADHNRGNSAAIAGRAPACDLSLLRVARWEEGLACHPATRLRSPSAAVRGKLRWVGRSPGAGARRSQDELFGSRRAPRHVARDHRGVVEAIRSGWADVGVCLRLATEEGLLTFIPIAEENYDLCYRHDQAAEPRIVSLLASIRSTEYRRLLAELPGYQAQAQLGEIEHVAARK